MNGDGRSDVICKSNDGGVMVWESKDFKNLYGPSGSWKDDLLGFCPNNANPVSIHGTCSMY